MPLNNFGIVTPRLYRCAQPDRQGFADLAALGVSLVLKLNSEREYPLARERAEFTGGVFAQEISTFQPDAASVRALVTRLVAFTAENRTAIHCTHGRDRTGLVVAGYRLLVEHWTLEAAQAERRTYGTAGIVQLATHEMDEVLAALAVR